MTTIAYRDGVLAADTRLGAGSMRTGRMIKAVALSGGGMAAACGRAVYIRAFLDYALSLPFGMIDGIHVPPEAASADGDEGLIVATDGQVTLFEEGFGRFVLDAPFYATGSGARFAMGAMQVGADAIRAIEAAIALDANSGGDITVVRLRERSA